MFATLIKIGLGLPLGLYIVIILLRWSLHELQVA